MIRPSGVPSLYDGLIAIWPIARSAIEAWSTLAFPQYETDAASLSHSSA